MNTTDFTKTTEMVETYDGLKLYVVRNIASAEPKAVLIILHGLANEHSLYDAFVLPGKAARV
jgi:alpha-beta hydrolase superfamily lysophospholipase